jgi:4-hydroxy-4-methyl-2-oxoglutarate aldolase
MTDLGNDFAQRLARLDSPAVSDATDRLGLKGRITGIGRLATDKRITGRVVTVRLGRFRETATPPRHLCSAAIEAAGPGQVIVVEQRTGIEAAGWGGILSNAARFRGVEGAIVDGPARDIDESRDLGFAVFARSAVPTTARGRIMEDGFNIAVTIGEVTVNPDDLVIADGSGIVFIRAADAEAVISAAETIAAREAAMTKAVLAGEPVSSVMGADYEHMLDGRDG